MKILRNNVLIKPATRAKVSDIIELTEDTDAKPQPYGQVLGVGPDVVEIAIGDMVHYEQFEHTVAPGEHIIIREGEILAKEGV